MRIILIIFLVLLSGVFGCSKSLLDEKPSSSLVVPTTLQDFDLLCEDASTAFCNSPELGQISCDDYYISDLTVWKSLPFARTRNAYIWNKDIFEGETQIPDWNYPYRQVFYANSILEGLSKIEPTSANRAQWNRLNGEAHFLRAYAYYNLAQVFCNVYQSNTANTVLGLPLKLSSDINEKTKRSSLEETYQLIESDTKEAIRLLPPFDASRPNRPGKATAFALGARISLNMGNYKDAGDYADSCLRTNSKLLNYSTINYSSNRPFPIFPQSNNSEILYYDKFAYGSWFTLLSAGLLVDTSLYNMYENDDLRKVAFFKSLTNGKIGPKAGYIGSFDCFTGLSVSEMYLIRAEAKARNGNNIGALNDLNLLLLNRWAVDPITKETKFHKISTVDADETLVLVLNERRKELIFRGIRWSDIRRLNREGYNINLKRILNNVEYNLKPNDSKYTFPIPNDEINISGIEQNSR